MSSTGSAETFTRIKTALESPSRDATIHDVKRAVIDEFVRVDRRVQVEVTDYFRHTFIPDLILRWSDTIDRPERWVFLRSKVSAKYLAEDIEFVARDQPIIFGLVPALQGEDDTPVQERSHATGTLVTDPRGVEELVASEEEAPVGEMVSRLILRGGRGIYDEQTAAVTTQSINSGFAGAFRTDAESTFAAAATIRNQLGENTGGRLLRLLHAIWVGSGGRSDQFPDAPSIDGPLSDDALELLIAGSEVADPDFWKRLGIISLGQLGRLSLGDRPANLRHLLSAHADQIEGRWCRVRPDEPRTGSGQELQWGVEGGAVALHGPTFTAFLALDKQGIAGVEPVERGGIAVEDLAERASFAEAEISDVTATGDGLIVAVASETNANILDNPRASDTVEAVAGNITRATATLRNGHVVVCDFKSTTATSRTKGTLSLRELVRHGLPLVWNLHEDERSELDALLAPVTAIASIRSAQPTLFDSVDDENDEEEQRQDAPSTE